MTTIQIQTTLSIETLLDSLPQFGSADLDRIVQRAAMTRTQRRVSNLAQAESELLLAINTLEVPIETQNRCAILTEKAHEGMISAEEQNELFTLIDEIELLNAKRMSYVLELAQLKGMPIDQLMSNLAIKPLSYE